MKSVCLILEASEPLALNWYWPEYGYKSTEPYSLYFNTERREKSYKKHVKASYAPVNDLLLKLISENGAKFSLNLTGNFLDMCTGDESTSEQIAGLVDTGHVEILGTPYYNNLSCFYASLDDFKQTVEMHRKTVSNRFGYYPHTFANAELIFDERISRMVKDLGFTRAIMQSDVLDPRFGFHTESGVLGMAVHPSLSADVMHRFSDRSWVCYPLIAEKYASWISGIDGEVTVLYLDYNTFGLRHPEKSGIFKFLAALPRALNRYGLEMIKPSEYAGSEIGYYRFYDAVARRPIKDILGNHMQHLYYNEIKRMEGRVKQCGPEYLDIWRRLQSIDVLSGMTVNKPWYPWDKAISNLLLLSDFNRRLIEAIP